MPAQSRRQFLKTSVGVTAALSTGSTLPETDYRRTVLAERSLLAYWPLDGNLSPARGEASGNGMKGDIAFIEGPTGGKAVDLRKGRFLTFGSRPELDTEEGTIELFFKLTAPPPPNYNPCLIAKRGSSPNTRYSVHVMSDLASFGLWNGQQLAHAAPVDAPLAVGRWYHLAVTSTQAEGLKVFVDGIPCPLLSGNAPFNLSKKGLPLQIGASAPDGAEPITAAFAEVAVYGAALDAQAIARHVDAAGMREHRRRIQEESDQKRREQERIRARKLAKRLEDPRLFERGETRIYEGNHLEAIRFTLGGIGAGCIQINGKGERAVWQIFNNFTAGHVPNSFLAVRAKPVGGQPVVRALQTSAAGPFPAMESVRFRGEYPFAWYGFDDAQLPVTVQMEAFSPLVPLDTQSSAIPCAVFRVTVRNRTSRTVETGILAAQQNAVGYDGKGSILDRRFAGYGGNRNRVEQTVHGVLLNMTSDRPKTDPAFGSMTLACLDRAATGAADIASLRALRDSFASLGELDGPASAGPTPPGTTLDGALTRLFTLKPKEARTVTFVLAWHFPNAKHGGEIEGWSHAGNRYAGWWLDAAEVAGHVARHWKDLYAGTRAYHDTLYASNLPQWLLDRISSQVAVLRSKTCFWAADGYFGAWEGCAPENGCCAGNCTHVWHYAQAHARLFPDLARRMREQTYRYQKPNGGLPHRHPTFDPAADGHLGDILGAYREHLTSPDGRWLQSIWPKVKKAMEYAISTWDPDQDGTLAGAQWNTLDGALGGSTTWIGSLYLSALTASEEMAAMQGDSDFAARCARIQRSGAEKQNSTLWNGEYYVQKRDPEPRHDYADGCEIDQLLGEWWAKQVGLETSFPPERVRLALLSLVKYNFRPDFHGVTQVPRKFVADEDAGLQMIQWPKGPRPSPTILYGDEVMSGFEYAAAATMIQNGLLREGFLVALATSDRYDGRLRSGLTPGGTASWGYSGNPFGDDECGKYYARAMSVWSLLLACQGFFYDGPAKQIGFLPVWRAEDHASFFTAAEGWGLFSQKRTARTLDAKLQLKWGTLALKSLVLAAPLEGAVKASARIAGRPVKVGVSAVNGRATITLEREAALRAGESLTVALT